jgi:hypothetical protein
MPLPLALIGIGSTIKNVAKKIPMKAWLIMGAVIFYIGSCWYWNSHGKNTVKAEWEASIKRGNVVVADLKRKQIQIVKVVETKYVDKVKVIHEKAKIITKEIPVYIAADTPDLPPAFRVFHDAAATGETFDASRIPDAASTPVRTATETITKNYETYQVIKARLDGLQEFYRLQQAAYQESCKSEGVVCN